MQRKNESLQLHSNGVLHSQWNPDEPFAGNVWDCLSLPALYRPVDSRSRILMLGVGGGAAIHQLGLLVGFESLVGVEINPIHLHIARHWFGMTSKRVQLREADAVAWVQASDRHLFDLVIDDLFGHSEGKPQRAQPLGDAWVERLRDLLTPTGIVVVNCADVDELAIAAPVFADAGFRHAVCWSCPGHVNAIGVFSLAPLSSREWSRRLETLPLSDSVKRAARLTSRQPLQAP